MVHAYRPPFACSRLPFGNQIRLEYIRLHYVMLQLFRYYFKIQQYFAICTV